MSNEQPQGVPEVKLPTQEWERIPSLSLIGTEGAEFEQVKPLVQQSAAGIEALVDGPAAELNSALHESGASLRSLLESSSATPVGSTPTPDAKRVVFLWGTSYLLEAIGDALAGGAQGEDASQLRGKIGRILQDVLCAAGLAEPEEHDDAEVGAPKCATCYPTYKACTLPPQTCMNNYSNCLNTCVP